jgi:hypothetical protein
MPLYWAATAAAGVAVKSGWTPEQIGAALAAAGYVLVTGILWWFDSQEPPAASVDVYVNFSPDSSWICANHPSAACYGTEWGCAPRMYE